MAHVATITIDYTKVPGDLTDYVGLIVPDGSAGYSALYALCLEGGGDIRLFKSDDTTELAREIVSFSVTSETGEIHYKYSGTLSSSVDTAIHVYADGSSADYAVTATYGRNAVWSDYGVVLHLNTSNSTTVVIDSTGNLSPSKKANSQPSQVTGKIGDGQDFAGGSHYINVAGGTDLAYTADFTASLWIKTTDLSGPTIFGAYSTSSPYAGYGLGMGSGKPRFWSNTEFAWREATNTVNNGAWRNLHFVLDGSTIRHYLDGATNGTGASSAPGSVSLNRYLGVNSDRSSTAIAASMDEFRTRSGLLSANHIAAEYNNQNSYSTFYSVAAVAGSSAAQAARRGVIMMM